MTKSEHKEILRECPACHKTKLFPARQHTCSNACATLLRVSVGINTHPTSGAPKNTREDEFTATEWIIRMNSDRVHSYDDLVRESKVNLAVWEPGSIKIKHYEVTYVPPATRKSDSAGWVRNSATAITVPMTSFTASFKKRVEVIAARNLLEHIKLELGVFFSKKLKPLSVREPITGNVLELNISDHHFNKLAWGKETGGRDWDLALSRESWHEAFEYLDAGTRHYNCDEVLLVIGNDLMHIDNFRSETTSGTQVDSDTRYQKAYCAVLEECIWAIRTIRERGVPVRVVIVPGNHDTQSSFTIGVALQYALQTDPGITVDNGPNPRKVYAFGKCLVAWEHGHAGKHKLRPLNLAVEHPDLWGSTEHREIHTGHEHHIYAEDIQTVIVRKVASLGPNDRWHHTNGYMAQRNAEAIIWNKERGVIGTCLYVAPSGRQLLNREAA